MIAKQTLEIRWYELSVLPSNVYDWFQCNCPGEVINIANSRTDYYLWIPKNDSMSVKLRENALEMKWRDNNFNKLCLNLDQNNTSIWQGCIERWIKWRHEPSLSSDLQKAIRSNIDHSPWIAVDKKRWQKLYKNVEIELTEITVNHQDYWSFAFEMEETLETSIKMFSKVVEDIYKTIDSLYLGKEQCYAYPSLLRNSHLNSR